MSYTREMEAEFVRTAKQLSDAKTQHDAVRTVRDEHKSQIGELLLECPRGWGPHGAAEWAIRNAVKLSALLKPFV